MTRKKTQKIPVQLSTGAASQTRALETADTEFIAAMVVCGRNEDDQSMEERLKLISRIIKDLLPLDARRLKAVKAFAEVAGMHISETVTPVEDFIVELPGAHVDMMSAGVGHTPDSLAGGLEEMRLFWEDGIDVARRFQKRHPPQIAASMSS